MHIISEKKLREFWERRPDAEEPLRAWIRVARRARWESFAELRATYAHADVVGRLVVFNIGGNKYRLIAAIHFNRAKVYIRHVLTHVEYDRGSWKEADKP
jgi:mRNA interferase HigB